MFNLVRPLPTWNMTLTAPLIAALLAMTGCDSQTQSPGVTQDATHAPDLTDDSAAGDSATSPEDGVTPPEDSATPPADTTTPPQDSATPPEDTADTTTPDTTEPADTSTDTSTDTTTDTAIVLPTVRPPVVATSSTFIGDWQMDVGKETTKCVVKRLDNPDVLWVSQVRTVLNNGSHHLIIYKSDETEEKTTPFNCDPFVQTLKGTTFPLMITQISEETLTFPNGVAFRFEPHQMIRLEAHYLNYFPHEIEAHADVHFDGIAASDVAAEANMLFYGNFDIDIPEGEYSTPWRYLTVLPDTHIFAVTGHTHAYGTNVEIAKSTSVEDVGMSIYPADEPFTWSEAPVEQFDPPLLFGHDEGLRYRCSWNNTSGERLGLGESARDEMCFLWAYYYPSQGYRLCGSPGSIGNGVAGDEVCCPGHWVCDFIAQFF